MTGGLGFRFSIIVPTWGRRSLERTLHSIAEQELAAGDEVLLVTDGSVPFAGELFSAAGLPGRCAATPATRDFGGSQRNHGMDLAHGDYLLFMDDDDAFTPGAFRTIRAALREAPVRPHLFRMRYAADGRVLWADRSLTLGNVSTQMIVLPNRPDLARWDSKHGHDYRFLRDNLPRWPAGSLVWREEVICLIRPRQSPAVANPPRGPLPVEECPYRSVMVAGDGRATCRLVEQILGAEDRRLSEVRRDACSACCAAPAPSPVEINPVVASLLYAATERIVEAGGVPGCSAGRAAGLQAWAELYLRLESPPPASVSTPPRALRPCAHLGAEVGFRTQAAADGHRRLPVFACHHPAHQETTVEECRRCRDWADRPGPPRPLFRQLVPVPAQPRGPRVRRWAVGVTTAPRRLPTLDWCLDSLIRAGWVTPRLFVDSAVTVAGRFADLPVSLRDGKLGAWPSYYLALVELLMREPEADAFFLVQDDVILYDREDLRDYLEQALWPADPVGAVSLFCSSAYTHPTPGWHSRPEPWFWGAQAFVFPRDSARRFVADPDVLGHRWSDRYRGLAHIDVVIGEWAARHGLPIFHPTPSLAQHVGDTSTLWPEARIDGHRRADWFAGADDEPRPGRPG
jgi:hypothetical protein